MTTTYTYNPTHLNHTQRGHPENAQRLVRTWDLLERDGILNGLQRVACTAAPSEAITAVHSADYVARLEEISQQGGGRLDADTYVTPDSFEIALLSAGGLLAVTDAVLRGEAENGFALIRPPGHHARPPRGMGFCLFGNVAIAARHAQAHYDVERVLIVDFDVHHGNGTQEIFYDDPSVLFFSIHQSPHYPGTGDMDETGAGPGQGKSVNVPFPPGVGDAGYLAAFQEILAPLARQHRPDLILLSAGYDAHWMDPLAHHQVSIAGFAAMVEASMALAGELCDGRLLCTLEGGYNLDILPHAILSTLRTLSRDPRGISDPVGIAPDRERDSSRILAAVKRIHAIG
jgi:acetoin utilization deacetylase AcuC-like enzyme